MGISDQSPNLGQPPARMFIPQPLLEGWMDKGQVQLNGSCLAMPKLEASYGLEAAFRFVSSDSGTMEELVGKVLSEERLNHLGGELMGDSVIFGEDAFTVESGYIAVLDGG